MNKKKPITQYPSYQPTIPSYNHSKQYSKISLESQPSFDSLSWKHQINSVCQIPGTKNPNIHELDRKYRGSNKYKQKENSWETDLTKKLMKLREQFKGIPNWQKHVRQILFENNDKHDNNNIKKVQKQYTRIQPLGSTFNKEQESQNFLFDSNVSFQIKQTATIEQQKTLMSRNNTSKNLRAGQLSVKQFQLYSAKKSANKSSKMRESGPEGKRVDERIEQIERKIRNCEEQKRKLNIDIPRKSLTPIRNQNKSGEKSRQKLNLQTRQKSYTKLNTRQATINDEHKFTYSQMKPKDLPKPPKYPEHPKYNKPSNEITQFGLSPRFAAEPKETFPSIKSQAIYKKEPKFMQQSDYKHTVEQWGIKTKKQIENRRRIRSQYQLPSRQKKEIRKFINRISQQIKLDEQFKNNKVWLQACKQEQKWKILKKILAQEDINLSIEETKKLFSLNHEEDNPFFSVNSFQSSYENVVNSFIKSEDYWVDHIYHKFNRETLIDEGFNRSTIDLDKKGYIVLEDIVRFLNMETGTFFRNRDAVTIFKRIANQNRFTYQQLIDTICD